MGRPEDIAALVQLRTDTGLTQAQMARRLRTTQSAVARLETGAVMPRLDTLQRYAEALGHHLELRPVPRPARSAPSEVDISLLVANRKLTPLERLRNLERFVAGVDRMRRAMPARASGRVRT